MVDGTQGDGSGDWAQGLRPVTRSRVEARNGYDRASRWYRFLEEPFERRAQAVGLDLLHAQPGESILELGCGTGDALVALARAVGGTGHLTGLDLSRGCSARPRHGFVGPGWPSGRNSSQETHARSRPPTRASTRCSWRSPSTCSTRPRSRVCSPSVSGSSGPGVASSSSPCLARLRSVGQRGSTSGSTTASRPCSTAARSTRASRSGQLASSRHEGGRSRSGVSVPRPSSRSGLRWTAARPMTGPTWGADVPQGPERSLEPAPGR